MPSEANSARAVLVTPPGDGGISVIALQGPAAAGVLDACFVGTRRSAGEIRAGAIAHGRIVRDGDVLDEVIVARFDDPSGPAGGPLYEINCHGGAMAVRAVLDRLREAGAQAMDRTDVLRRELPGRRTLSPDAIRAAAMSALPRAQTRLAVRMLLHQAEGALTRELGAIRQELSEGCAGRLQALLDTAPLGEALLIPPTVMLAGPPNVGKSTLLNALLHRERVIVHPQPGTTRDIVRETVSVRGVPFELVDAAGILTAAQGVEAQAVRRAAALIGRCDVALLLFDVRQGAAAELRDMPQPQPCARKILVGNKIDLIEGVPAAGPLPSWLGDVPQVFVSARQGRNLDGLEAALLEPYRGHLAACEGGGAVVFSRQIREALERIAARLAERGPAQALCELASLS